jgi:4-hydroxyacetophenone monooxygenase
MSDRHVEPIREDDARIEAALREAHLPTLMAALVHLTGDLALLREHHPLVFDIFGDGQGGLTSEQQERIRTVALEAIRAYRDGGCVAPPPPSREAIREIMDFLAGQPIPEHYVPFLLEELDLEFGDTKARRWLDGVSDEAKRGFRVLVIGGGMSGILAGIRLGELGIPYTLVDKNPDFGGTWLENTYPGCRVDSPNHMYSFSFARHEWPQYYSTQDVLLDYFRSCADAHAVREHARFGSEVEEAAWDDAARLWRVVVRGPEGRRETLEANAVISAVGQLNRPKLPDVPGLDRFGGVSFHSAAWRHDVDLTGKRVAVIGTGASAFQFVPEIAERTAELIVFQRSAPWLGPTPNYHDDVSAGHQWVLRHVPYCERWYRFWLFWLMTDGLLPAVTADPDWKGSDRAVSELNDDLRMVLTEYIRSQVPDDPELAAAAVPDYPPGGKRMLRDNGVWLATLRRDDVRLVTRPIREVTPAGIVTEDGEEHAVDVIIYGTGFQASRFLWPMKVTGRGGRDLNDHWGGDARAYLGITVPGFPNLFCMYGPNTNIVVNGSIIFFSECEIRYILGCLELLLEGGHAALDVRPDVHDAFNARVDAGNARMAWGAPQVSSWYKNAKGRVSQNWPFALVDYWILTQAPDPDDYELL